VASGSLERISACTIGWFMVTSGSVVTAVVTSQR
jgi:hypothetical protein